MAARFKPKTYTLTGSAATLKDILASANDEYISNLVVRAGWANVGRVFWEAGGVQGGYLEAREAASFDLSGKFISTNEISFNGTSGDTIYITVVG